MRPKESKNEKLARELRAAARTNMLKGEAMHGRCRTSTWGGEDKSARANRRKNKRKLQKGDF